MEANITANPTLESKRNRILAAGLSLLASKGFHGFSIKHLAERAGVATGTLYLYFKDREDLIRQLHTEIIAQLAEYLFAEYDAGLSLEKQYRVICRRFWRFSLENPEITLSKVQFDHLPPEVLRLQRQSARQAFRLLVQLFEQGRAARKIKDLPDEVLVNLAIEPYGILARKQILGLINISERELERVIDASWDAMAFRPAE